MLCVHTLLLLLFVVTSSMVEWFFWLVFPEMFLKTYILFICFLAIYLSVCFNSEGFGVREVC